nr:unnamed protein product [Callosobruchus chinensis]
MWTISSKLSRSRELHTQSFILSCCTYYLVYSILDAVQRRTIRLTGDPTLTCQLQPLSYWRAVGDLSLFYRYSNGFCSSELTSIILLLSKPADAPAELLLLTPGRSFFVHQEPNDTTAPLSPRCPGPGMDCLVIYLLSLRVLAYSSPLT